jgi:hypothetical protein
MYFALSQVSGELENMCESQNKKPEGNRSNIYRP